MFLTARKTMKMTKVSFIKEFILEDASEYTELLKLITNLLIFKIFGLFLQVNS